MDFQSKLGSFFSQVVYHLSSVMWIAGEQKDIIRKAQIAKWICLGVNDDAIVSTAPLCVQPFPPCLQAPEDDFHDS